MPARSSVINYKGEINVTEIIVRPNELGHFLWCYQI